MYTVVNSEYTNWEVFVCMGVERGDVPGSPADLYSAHAMYLLISMHCVNFTVCVCVCVCARACVCCVVMLATD